MNHFETWNFKDKFPDKPLQDIKLVSERANSLWKRNINLIKINDGAINIVGILETLEALDYHYTNFINFKDTINVVNQKHEIIAYLNRIGQVYYFSRSEFVRKHIKDPNIILKKVNQLKIFRDKIAAHRSLDSPNGEPIEYRKRQAISLLGLTYFIVDGDKTQYLLPTHSKSSKTKWHYFTPEMDHQIVMQETYTIMELIIEKII